MCYRTHARTCMRAWMRSADPSAHPHLPAMGVTHCVPLTLPLLACPRPAPPRPVPSLCSCRAAVEQRSEMPGRSSLRVSINCMAVDPTRAHVFCTGGADALGECTRSAVVAMGMAAGSSTAILCRGREAQLHTCIQVARRAWSISCIFGEVPCGPAGPICNDEPGVCMFISYGP